jgi:hypothetical protein
MSDTSSAPSHRDEILASLAELKAIELGTLKEEYRERPAPDGKGIIRNGPYYKHQCWENGANRSSRIPADQVDLLRGHLEQGEEFQRLVEELTTLAIAGGRAQRTASSQKTNTIGADPGSKKNSGKQASKKNTAKPKPSSRKSPRACAKRKKGPKT